MSWTFARIDVDVVIDVYWRTESFITSWLLLTFRYLRHAAKIGYFRARTVEIL